MNKPGKLKVLFVDLETAPNLAYVWEKYEQDVIAFVKERYLMAFAWKYQGDKKVSALSLKTMKEKALVSKLRDLFDEADVIVAHNGDQFDIKMSYAFFIKHNLKPPSPFKTIDTKKLAKYKFRFNSNKLDDLGNYLGLGRKIRTGGFDLWLDCIAGNKRAWDKMMAYNKQDIVLLEKVYDKLKVWTTTNIPVIYLGEVCQSCGGNHFIKRGWHYASHSRRARLVCQSCGKWTSGKIEKYE